MYISIKTGLLIIVLFIVSALQLRHNGENIGYYTARIQECGKPTNSNNYQNTNILKHPDGFAMKAECMELANNVFERNHVWFWNANYSFDENWYNELWHY